MACSVTGPGENLLQKATLEYLNLSQNTKIRHVLEFFSNYPEIILVETSKMGNPYHIITTLAESYDAMHSGETTDVENRCRGRQKYNNLLQDRFIAGVLFWCGLRKSELILVKKRDIDLISKTFNVPTLKQRKKEVVYRAIPLDHVPTAELKFWNYYFEKCRINADDPVISVSPRTVERATKRLLGMHPHALRHGLGLFLYEVTKDIRLVSQILRHSNITNTMIYTKISLDAVREKLRFGL